MTDKIDELASAFQDGFTNGNAAWDGTPEHHRDAFREGVKGLLARLSSIEGKEPGRIDRQRVFDALTSASAMIRAFSHDDVARVAIAELSYVNSVFAASPAPPVEGTADAIPSKVRGWPKPGDKMRFLDEGGYPRDLVEAREHFAKGQIETVRDFHLGDWHSTIAFEDIPGHFNSVMFEHVDDAEAAALGERDE